MNDELRLALCGPDEFLPNRRTQRVRAQAVERVSQFTSQRSAEHLVDIYLEANPWLVGVAALS